MNNYYKNLSLIFAAGGFGGLVKGVVAWLFGAWGINALLGSSLAPALSPAWIYQHVVWGGIWGLLFLLPVRGISYPALGALYSLPQSLIMLLVLFPKMGQAGLWGLGLGHSTPGLILFFGVVWGVAAGLWLKVAREGK
jgi:hypothetical protein